MSGRCIAAIRDQAGEVIRWVDVPHLWTVEEDEMLEDTDPPPVWCYTPGQRLSLVDDNLCHWQVEVMEEDHCDWEVLVGVVEAGRYTIFAENDASCEAKVLYGEGRVQLVVPRQRLVTPHLMESLDAVESVLEAVLRPGEFRIRELTWDECDEHAALVDRALDSLAPLVSGCMPYDSYPGHFAAWCEDVLDQIQLRKRTMPKQITLLEGVVAEATKPKKVRKIPAALPAVKAPTPPPAPVKQASFF